MCALIVAIITLSCNLRAQADAHPPVQRDAHARVQWRSSPWNRDEDDDDGGDNDDTANGMLTSATPIAAAASTRGYTYACECKKVFRTPTRGID